MKLKPGQCLSTPSSRSKTLLSAPLPRRHALAIASLIALTGTALTATTSAAWAASLGRGGNGGFGVGAVNSPGAGYGQSASPAHTGVDPTIGGGGGGGGAGGGYGGDGGIAIYPIGGGAGGLLWGEDGGNGSSIGSGGGGGGGGGAHGFVGTTIDSSAVVPAGAGGAGAASLPDGGGGGGGAGGYGAVVTSGGTNTGLIQGGNGGAGGSSINGAGGGGGEGGNGLFITGIGSVTNSGTIKGGNGGAGAAGSSLYGSGNGANGGAGVVFAAGGTLDNRGTIQGGDGSAGGDVLATEGFGGEGVVASNLTVVNSGQIAGGLSPDGIRALAISFTGGNNTLELRAGHSFTGDVLAVGGGTNVLRLGGAGNAAFNVGQIYGFPVVLDNVTQYVGFTVFEKTGSSTWRLTGTTANTSPWTVKAGSLLVNGSVAGAFTVQNGATLGGTGTVGTTVLDAGATIAPGDNGIGILHVNGDLSFDPASTYRVKAAADGTSDRIIVSGTAHLAGSVMHVGPNGNFAPSQTYVILSAGALDGTFDSVRSDQPFLDAGLSYGPKDVSLTLTRNQVAFSSLGQTGNQRATATALDSLPASNALATQVSRLSAAQAPAAYDALSGEMHASVVTGLYGVADTVAALPFNQLRDNLHAGWLPGTPVAQAQGIADASALPRSAARPLWAQVFGNWQSWDGDDNAARVKASQGGLFFGGDVPVGEGGWRAGGAFGYINGRTKVDARDSHADTESYSLSAYSGKAFRTDGGTVNVLVGGAWTWHDISSRRTVQVAGLNQQLDADYDGSTAQMFAEAGYALSLGKSLTLEPFAGWAWSRLRTESFAESGGSAALSANGDRSHVSSSTLGLRTDSAVNFGSHRGSLQAMAGWRHAYGDVTPQSSLRFAGSSTFTAEGAPIARDSLVLSLGAQMAVSERTSVAFSYDGQFGEGNRQSAARINANWRF